MCHFSHKNEIEMDKRYCAPIVFGAQYLYGLFLFPGTRISYLFSYGKQREQYEHG